MKTLSPWISDFTDGVATRVVSHDMALASYQDPQLLYEVLKRDVERIAAFDGSLAQTGSEKLFSQPVIERRLIVVVPDHALTSDQVGAINRSVRYANSCSVSLSFTIGR